MTLEEVKKFITDNNENEELQKYLNSLADKRVNQAIETYQKKTESIKIQELQDQITTLQNQNKRTNLELLAKSKGIPDTMLELVIGETEIETIKKADQLLSSLNNVISANVETEINKRLGGKSPEGGDSKRVIKDLKDMSEDEIYSNLDEITEQLKQ